MTDANYWTQESFYDEFQENIAGICRKAARDIPGIDVDDLYQNYWVWACTPRNWKQLETMEPGLIVTSAKRKIRELARDLRIKTMEDRGEYMYTTGEIRGLLAECIWDDISMVPDIEGHIDVRRAFATLSPAQKNAIFRRYALGIHLEGGSAEQKAESRGVTRIAEYLNIGGGPGIEIPLDGVDYYHRGGKTTTIGAQHWADIQEDRGW